jgi:hypothetical protein
MEEALSSTETSVLTRATWRNNPEDTIRHSHRRENLKSYKSSNNSRLIEETWKHRRAGTTVLTDCCCNCR